VALAITHAAGATSFGGETDGFISKLPLPNAPCDSWAEFYAVRRVLPYLKLARDRGAVSETEATLVERVIGKLTALLPEEPPARLHGDLWNGNVLWGQESRVWLIDPAAYGGHRELDLAMLALFGLPHLPRVLEAYQDKAPLADGWEERIPLHQLFPLLVHVVLFGRGYAGRAVAAARAALQAA
jgi:fructosamine-3-kinase